MSDRPERSPTDAPPRFSGIRTFARRPHRRELDGVDVAVVGVPFDGGTSFRPGARFGPEAVRSASVLLRDYHPALDVDVFGSLEIVDRGDVELSTGNAQRAVDEIAAGLAEVVESGAVTLAIGGDHTIALGELRALAAHHGPLGLLLIDAHADTWDTYRGERYFHGTSFRRAVEEGVLDPSRSLMAGMRGPLYSAEDLAETRRLGFELVSGDELHTMQPADFADLARSRLSGGPAFLSFDIDAIDPAFAPATGTPEVGGLTSHEALALLRSLAGMRFAGFDVVEVSPPYDDPGATTAVLAANLAYELLALAALAKRAASG